MCITTREELDNYKSKCERGRKKGHDTFFWKGSLVDINDAKVLIKKLENSRDLSTTHTLKFTPQVVDS